MSKLKATPDWLRANVKGSNGVDREREVISGVIVAEEGDFKTPGRGAFDGQSLRSIVRLMRENKAGTKGRFTHPGLSSDGLGTYLGRFKEPRRDKIMRPNSDGTFRQVEIVRADMHLDPTSHTTPNGDLGKYVLDLAESDPDAFGTSLVLKADQEQRLDSKGRPLLNDKGEPLSPLWRPTEIHALDCVDTGDATNSFLSVDDLPDAVVRRATELLDKQFGDAGRDVIEARCKAWLDRYLSVRFGDPEEASEDDTAVDDEKPAKLGMSKEVAELHTILAERKA
jgi:hypothetical protein